LGLFLFEADPALAAGASEPGWPLLFSGEVEATPVITDVNREWRADLVVRTHDGEVHVLATGSVHAAEAVTWSPIGHDPWHTTNVTTVGPENPVPAFPSSMRPLGFAGLPSSAPTQGIGVAPCRRSRLPALSQPADANDDP
jgi:hypothetical protein